jgi:hypothetical protein
VVKTDILASAALGNAVFELLRDVVLPSGYGSVSGEASVRARVGTGEEWTPVDSLPALIRWAADQGLVLATEVARAPDVFAEFVAGVELGIRVISSPELYGFVEERFPVLLGSEGPRVEGDRLLFLGGRFDLREQPAIWRVSVDLVNGTVEQAPVQPRPSSTDS